MTHLSGHIPITLMRQAMYSKKVRNLQRKSSHYKTFHTPTFDGRVLYDAKALQQQQQKYHEKANSLYDFQRDIAKCTAVWMDFFQKPRFQHRNIFIFNIPCGFSTISVTRILLMRKLLYSFTRKIFL